MSWIFIACIPPFLWAFSNLFDEYMGKHHFAKSGALLICLSASFAIVPAAGFALFHPPFLEVAPLDALLMAFLGVFIIIAFIPYIWALQMDNSSNAVPIFQTIPVFAFILGWIFLGESATPIQLSAAAIIITAAAFVGFDFKTRRINMKSIGWMLLSSFAIALYMLGSKVFIEQYGWQVFAIWDWMGASFFGLLFILIIPGWRGQAKAALTGAPFILLTIFFLQIVFELSAAAFWYKAIEIGPSAALVQTLNGLQPAFVLILSMIAGLVFHRYFPKVAMDRVLIFKFLMIGVIMVGVYLLTL